MASALIVTKQQRDALNHARHDVYLDTPAKLLRAVLDGDKYAIEALRGHWPGDDLTAYTEHRVRVTAKIVAELRKHIPKQNRGASDSLDSASCGLTAYLLKKQRRE